MRRTTVAIHRPGGALTALAVAIACSTPARAQSDVGGEGAALETALHQAGLPGRIDARVVLTWNQQAHDIALAEDQFLTFKGQRALAMMHLAMHDALNAIVPLYERYALPPDGPHAADPITAAAQAAHDVLAAAYPDQRQALDSTLGDWLAAEGPLRDRGVALGRAAAAAILARRAGDRWNGERTYAFVEGPGQYQTTPPWNGFVAHPGFALAQPFTSRSASRWRPPPPPASTSAAYARAYDEVRQLGARDSATRTADQSGYAVWWMEFAEGSVNRLARRMAADRGMHLWAAARLFAQIGVSLYDGYVAVWDSKYAYNHWRPYTAIRADDGNPRTTADPAWEPLRPTPPFPEYVSAHAAACAASFGILSAAFGRNVPFTMDTTTAPPDMPTRTFASFADAARECADSRVLLGWHFRYATDAGLELGARVARHVVRHTLRGARGRASAPAGRLIDRVVDGRSLLGNQLGEPTDRPVSIYLPPRYREQPRARYPVVYLLSGMGGDHRNFAREGAPNRLGRLRSPQVEVGLDVAALADALIASGEMPEAILVGISGLNTYANHWFACSDTIGDYRSWVVRDIVPFVDREYRTRPDRNHRAILGHSSGAFGALSLALAYPETFGAVAALSPAGNDFEAKAPGGVLPRVIDLFFRANPSDIAPPVKTPVDGPISDAAFAALWGQVPGGGRFVTNVIYSAGAAFSSNLGTRPLLFDFPFAYPQKAVLPDVLARWADADLVSQVTRTPRRLSRTSVYLARGLGPTVLHPEVGDIPALRTALDATGVVHTYEELPGDHFTSLPQALRNGLAFVLAKRR